MIDDLLDIRIFSAMNNIIREKIRSQKDEINTLDLKKDNIKDKLEMQEKFIDELENRGKKDIEDKKGKIKELTVEADTHLDHNQILESNVGDLTKKQESLVGVNKK